MFDFQWLDEYREMESSWLIEGFLCPSINILSGKAKAGKSTLACHVISSLLEGTPFLGVQPINFTSNICWMGTDGGWKRELFTRLRPSIVRQRRILTIPMLPLDVDIWKKFGEDLVKHDVKVLVVDHLAGMSGGANLNEQQEAFLALQGIKAINEQFGITVLLISHSSKSDNKGASAHSYLIEATGRILLQLDGETRTKTLCVRGNEVEAKKFTIKLSPSECEFGEKVIKERKPRTKTAEDKVTKLFTEGDPKAFRSQSALGREMFRLGLAKSEEGGRQQINIWRKRNLVVRLEDGSVGRGPNVASLEEKTAC